MFPVWLLFLFFMWKCIFQTSLKVLAKMEMDANSIPEFSDKRERKVEDRTRLHLLVCQIIPTNASVKIFCSIWLLWDCYISAGLERLYSREIKKFFLWKVWYWPLIKSWWGGIELQGSSQREVCIKWLSSHRNKSSKYVGWYFFVTSLSWMNLKSNFDIVLATFFRWFNFCAYFCCTSVTHSKVFLKNLKVEQDFNCVLLPLSVNFPLVVNVNLWSFNSSEECLGRRNGVTICFGIIPGIRFRNYPGDKIVHTRSLGLINLTLDSSTLPSILFAERQGIQNIIQKWFLRHIIRPRRNFTKQCMQSGSLGQQWGWKKKKTGSLDKGGEA